MKKFYLETLSVGCPKNLIESSTYRKMFIRNNYIETKNKSSADYIVYNTCGCLNILQQKANNAIYSYRPIEEQQVIVAGCLPKIDKKNRYEEDGFKIVHSREYDVFKQIINDSDSLNEDIEKIDIKDYQSQPMLVKGPNKLLFLARKIFKSRKVNYFFKSIMMTTDFHYVTIGSGCSGKCTFCGIKKAIGEPQSNYKNQILNSFYRGIEMKKKDFWLVSDDIGSWGKDFNESINGLLCEILKFKEDFHLVLNYFEPDMFLAAGEKIYKTIADDRIIQICLPLQTGSQKVLKRMGRHYNIEKVLEATKKIRKVNKNIIIKSQFIVGFPGESLKDFLKTLFVMRYFDGCGVNAYSALNDTPAAKLKDLSKFTIAVRVMIAKTVSSILQLRVFCG